MRLRVSRWLALAVLVTATASALSARADPSADGESQIQRGIGLRRLGKNREALDAFVQAYGLTPTPRAEAQIALAHQALGEWVDAEQGLDGALRAGEDLWIARYRDDLERALATVRAHLGWLDVEVNVAHGELVIDDVGRHDVPSSSPVRVTAGSVAIEVRAPGFVSVHRAVDVAPGAQVRLTVALEPIPPSTAPPAQTPTASPGLATSPVVTRTDAPSRMGAYVPLAAAAVLVGAGIVSWRVREDEVAIYDDDGGCLVGTETRQQQCGSRARAANLALGIENRRVHGRGRERGVRHLAAVAVGRSFGDDGAPAMRPLVPAGHRLRGAILIRSRGRTRVALPLALLGLSGCTALKDGGDRARSVALDASADGQVASTCVHRAPPPPPNVHGSGGSLDLVFAVWQASFGYDLSSVDDAGRPEYLGLGFDLDDTCTGEGQGDSCLEPPWAFGSHTDGVDGIDNAAGQYAALLFPDVQDQVTTSEMASNQIFRVRGYSGDPDDDQVDVALYEGFGLRPRDGGTPDAGLQWDGDDAWMILPDTLAPLTDGGAAAYSLDQPRFHDDHAYVTAGVLVARLPEALWPASMPAAPSALAPVEQLVLAGNLVRVGPRWELQHLVIGLRDRIETLISLDARLVLSGSRPICQSATEYQGIKSRLCSFVDVASGPDSPTSPCDSLSAGSVMDAKQVVLGGIGPSAESLPAVCPPEVDHDSCDAAAP